MCMYVCLDYIIMEISMLFSKVIVMSQFKCQNFSHFEWVGSLLNSSFEYFIIMQILMIFEIYDRNNLPLISCFGKIV